MPITNKLLNKLLEVKDEMKIKYILLDCGHIHVYRHTPIQPSTYFKFMWITVFDLITALCAQVFQNYWEHSFVVKYVSTY